MKLPVKVLRKQVEARDICSFVLEHAEGKELPPATAGAHVSVELPDGLTRQYSLCNQAGSSGVYRVCVLRAPDSRGGSKYLHEQVSEGDVLYIAAPVNHFALAEHVGPALLLAGGIGVTPLFAMAQELHGSGREFDFHYFARSHDRTALREELVAGSYANRVQFHLGEDLALQQAQIQEALSERPSDSHLYVCGPAPFIDFVLSTARLAKWPEESLHWEHFGAVPSALKGNRAFEVEISSTGDVFRVEANQTVAQCLAKNGVNVPVSCEQGICGTCLTRVKAGEVDHRDAYLSDSERASNTEMLVCCSRAKSARLVLDL